MARTLYLLVIDMENEEWLAPLNIHEKLELKLSTPREFWPKTWVEEGEEGAHISTCLGA